MSLDRTEKEGTTPSKTRNSLEPKKYSIANERRDQGNREKNQGTKRKSNK